VAYFKILS